jgi:hypothetical protein
MTMTIRGRNQDKARLAGGQDHEVRYEATKEGISTDAVIPVIYDVGISRRKVESRLAEGD